MGYESRMLTNGEHDDLWRKFFQTVPKQLTIMNKLKFLELVGNCGMSNTSIRRELTKLASEIGYEVRFDEEES